MADRNVILLDFQVSVIAHSHDEQSMCHIRHCKTAWYKMRNGMCVASLRNGGIKRLEKNA